LFSLTKNLKREQYEIVYKDLWSTICKDVSLVFDNPPIVEIWQINRNKGVSHLLASSKSDFSHEQILDRSQMLQDGHLLDIDDKHFLYLQMHSSQVSESHKAFLGAVVEHLRASQEWRACLEKGFEVQNRIDLLHKITVSIRGTLDLSEVLATTARDLGQSLKVSRCFIRRYDPNNPGRVLATEQEYTEPDLMKASDTIFDFETDWMKKLSEQAHENKALDNNIEDNFYSNILYLKNAESLDDPEGWVVPLLQAIDLKTFLGVPLMYQGMVLGSLCFHQCAYERDFSQKELEFIRQVADEASVAIIHAEMYKHIQQQAKTDSLTGLRNKAAFHEVLDQEVERVKRTDGNLALMMVDLDYLKSANDNYGHIIGDEVIKIVGSKLNQTLRQVDICARFGGDEFGAILPDTSLEGAKQLAIRLVEEIKNTKHPIVGNLSASIGVAGTPFENLTKQSLIEEADQALYMAKDRGKGRACFSDDPMSVH
ncbi:MAG TPA: sensor domain-containing diguanylate cyclase, partial [Vampirovibrionales bacterium]